MNDDNKHETKRAKTESAQKTTCLLVESSDLQQSPIELDGSLLRNLLSPLDTGYFMKHCFRQCAVHIPSRGHDRIRSILSDMDDLNVERIIQNSASESIFVWLQQPDKTIYSTELDDRTTAYHLYKAGHAIYCRANPNLEQALVSNMLRDTGLGCGQYDPSGSSSVSMGRGEVETFVSTNTNHVTNWHFDFQENFTIQLSGIKRWKIVRGTVSHPLRACTPHYAAPQVVESQVLAARLGHRKFQFHQPNESNSIGAVEEVVLGPGDVFYFPAGMWHTIQVLEPGVSINISLMATNYAALTCQALQHLLLQKEEWRQCVSGDARGHLISLLKELPDIVRAFEQNSGADAILPPVLRHPLPEEANDNESATGEEEEMEGDDNNGNDPIASVANFVPTSTIAVSTMDGSARQTFYDRHCLVENPLATLLHEATEITPYYGQTPSDESLFVLAINFAGNEGHEAALRQCLSMNMDAVRRLQRLLEENASLDSFQEVETIDFLVHYGYLLWVPLRQPDIHPATCS